MPCFFSYDCLFLSLLFHCDRMMCTRLHFLWGFVVWWSTNIIRSEWFFSLSLAHVIILLKYYLQSKDLSQTTSFRLNLATRRPIRRGHGQSQGYGQSLCPIFFNCSCRFIHVFGCSLRQFFSLQGHSADTYKKRQWALIGIIWLRTQRQICQPSSRWSCTWSFPVVVMARANACFIASSVFLYPRLVSLLMNKNLQTAACCCCFVTLEGPMPWAF